MRDVAMQMTRAALIALALALLAGCVTSKRLGRFYAEVQMPAACHLNELTIN